MPHPTDTAGLEAGEIRIPTGDIELPGYYSVPKGARNLPVVLVVQEIFGVNAHIQDLCRRLGKRGYMAGFPQRFAGKMEEFVAYPNAGHAFHRPSYVEDAAQDGWKRMLAWFRQHGV